MKDLVRLRSSVKESVELALNQQIQMEMLSSSKYLAMAGWCDRNGLDHSAGFFYKQSEEERKHGMKFFAIYAIRAVPLTPPKYPPFFRNLIRCGRSLKPRSIRKLP